MGWFDFLKKKSAGTPATPTIAQEAGLSDNWQPIDVAPVRPSINPAGPPSYTQGSLPPQLGLQPDLRDTMYGGTVPVSRLMPVASVAAQNAAIAATVKQIIESTPSTGGGNVVLDMPAEFDVATSSTGTEEDITVTWAPEDEGTVFSGPPAGAVGFDASFSGSGENGGLAAVATVVGGQPSASDEFAFFIGNFQGGAAASAIENAASWTAISLIGGVLPGSYPAYVQQIPVGATSLTASVDYGSAGESVWTAALLYFGGSIPSFIQGVSTSTSGTGLASAVMAPPAAGNAFLVVVRSSTTLASGSVTVTVTDTQNLTQASLSSSSEPFNAIVGGGVQQDIFMLTGAANSAETINVQITGAAAGATASVEVLEMTPPTAVPSRPRFRVPPPTSLSNVTGILSEANGGTSANLSATGGTSQVLKQTTVGGAITVGQLAVADLSTATIGSGTKIQMATTQTGSGTVGVLATSPSIATPTLTGTTTAASFSMSGTVTKYNNINTVGQGVAPFYAIVNNLTATANIGLTTLYAVPGGGPGLYRLSYYVIVNRAATTSSTLPNLYFEWTDTDNSTLQTASFVSGTPTANTLTTVFSGVQVVSAKASTNIRFQTGDTTAYASVGGTTMQYSVRLRVEAL